MLDINSKQHSIYIDGEDEIEDLSEDPTLDEMEKMEESEENQNSFGRPMGGIESILGGGMFSDFFADDEGT